MKCFNVFQFFNNFLKKFLGVCYWQNGDKYKGQFLNGKAHGKGRIYRVGIDEEYKGEWVNGLYQGYGVLRTGPVEYRGEFFEGKKVKKIITKKFSEWNPRGIYSKKTKYFNNLQMFMGCRSRKK